MIRGAGDGDLDGVQLGRILRRTRSDDASGIGFERLPGIISQCILVVAHLQGLQIPLPKAPSASS
jgi:hypothetical protein